MTLDLDERIAFARRWADGSPFYHSMGISIDALDDGRATLRLDVSEAHLNADGIVHGGVLPALADATMGSALRTLHGAAGQLLTLESNLRYVRPAAAGAIVAQGRVVQAHRSVAFTEVEIAGPDGHLLAHGGGTFLIRTNE